MHRVSMTKGFIGEQARKKRNYKNVNRENRTPISLLMENTETKSFVVQSKSSGEFFFITKI